MIQLLSTVALAAFAADTGKIAANVPSVYEISVHALIQGEGQKVHDEIEDRLKKLGGIEAMTGRPDMIAFSFGHGPVAELKKKLTRAVDSLAGVGPLKAERERFNPTFEERREQARIEHERLARERHQIADALEKAPNIRDYVDNQLSMLEKIDPAKEERQGVLLVIVDGASPPQKPKK